MISGKLRRLAAACLALLALGTLAPTAAAAPLVEIEVVSAPVPEPLEHLVSPGGHFVKIHLGDGVKDAPGALIDRTLRFVDEFDPHDDLPTQMQNAATYAMDAFGIAQDSVDCVSFVADPTFLDRITVDLSGFPERLRVELPFAMATPSGYSMGYLLIVIRPSGELECGLGLDTDMLA